MYKQCVHKMPKENVERMRYTVSVHNSLQRVTNHIIKFGLSKNVNKHYKQCVWTI